MFEGIVRRTEARAKARAEDAKMRIVGQLRETLPRGVEADVSDEGVRLSGRALRRRAALDPALLWLLARLR